MSPRWRTWAANAAFGLLVLAAAIWAMVAAWFHTGGVWRGAALGLLALAVIAILILRSRSRAQAWVALALAALCVGVPYALLQPRRDRDWAPDVAHGITGTVDGDRVTLDNVRAFRWTDKDHAAEAWATQTVNLNDLTSLDLFTSTWNGPKIAHVLASFGFADGRHIVFSVEIRREKGEVYSTLGGFVRQFEQVLIAADEEDIVKLRTTDRGEDVNLYPIALSPEKRRELFLNYLALGNDFAAHPRWYNTVTGNCASSVYRMVNDNIAPLPFDWRLLLTGGVPDYLNNLGFLAGTGTMEERRARAAISARAKEIPAGADYSTWIRGN